MFIGYTILKLSKFENFAYKNDPGPPPNHNLVKEWNASQQALVKFHTTGNRIFFKLRGRN